MSMTENEAKGVIPYNENSTHTEFCEKCLYIKSQCKCKKSEINAGCISINEAQEYLLNRYLVVGSPVNPPKEECEKHNAVLDIAIQAIEEVQAYRAIGTVEDIQLIFSLCKDLERIVKKYEAIGTVEEFKALKEKMASKKVVAISLTHEGRVGNCPNCNNFVAENYDKNCPKCRRELDWS